MAIPNFDVAALRSLVAGIDLGSFARAADRVGRSTSAVSAQLRKLEEQAGAPLFRKSGRGLALTDAGETLLDYARRIIELNDEAANAVRGAELNGWMRLGMQEDFGEAMLPEVLGRFARAHPKVRIEARVARNVELLARIGAHELDFALVWGDAALAAPDPRAGVSRELVADAPMRWIGAATAPWTRQAGEPLPLVAFDRPCAFFSAATAALDRARIPWRIAFTSPSLAGLWAAAAAGLGLTVRTDYGVPASVSVLDAPAHGLPALPALPLVLLRAPSAATPTGERLAAIVLDAVRAPAAAPLRAA